ncbi:tetratricopeptide repeat protein [Seonamhaeicola marinus]|uniref:Tetratricopeptide repeat protein n=1 Tax=Seonamhaeicola marinus TaxID=1912246 RepID=A0A5D0HXR6_9FLAO|nr:tetratricopeptide repeat protein [Seonamhaeicola marinus]TYA74242.1 tetratricopeptide repeat protein [Seonamhaeicola marinus]
MKLKIRIFIVFLFTITFSYAQNDLECKTKLSLFHQEVNVKNFDKAYDNWKFVKDSCPALSIAIYADGEKILRHKIKTSQGGVKKEYLNELLEVWKKRAVYYPNKTPKGVYIAKTYQLKYDNKKLLQNSNSELYEGFDMAFQTDKKNFTHPKSLYTYFSLVVDLQDEGKKTLKEVFNKYDDVNEKIEEEVANYSTKLNELIAKVDENKELTRNEKSRKTSYESYLKNYDVIKSSISKKLDDRADCVNLIPFYTKDFENHKSDAVWLKRAVSKMHQKECSEDPLYETLVIAYDEVAPSADTKFYIAYLLMKKGKINEAEKYLSEAYDLETDAFKKSKLAYKIGQILKKRKSYSKARVYFRRALKLNPSNGKPHLAIADMYAKSANNCGDTEFNKRAVYWLAAKEAKKASRVDPTLRRDSEKFVTRYEALAPSKQMVFICSCSGTKIDFSCWIADSIIVPAI